MYIQSSDSVKEIEEIRNIVSRDLEISLSLLVVFNVIFRSKIGNTNFEYFLYRPLCMVIYKRENKLDIFRDIRRDNYSIQIIRSRLFHRR